MKSRHYLWFALILACFCALPATRAAEHDALRNALLPLFPFNAETTQHMAAYCMRSKETIGPVAIALSPQDLETPRLYVHLDNLSRPYSGVINPLYLHIRVAAKPGSPAFDRLADRMLHLAGLEKLSGCLIQTADTLSAQETCFVVKALSSLIKEADPSRLVALILPDKGLRIEQLATCGIAFYVDALCPPAMGAQGIRPIADQFPAMRIFYQAQAGDFSGLVAEHAANLHQGFHFGIARMPAKMARLRGLNALTKELFDPELLPEPLDEDFLAFQQAGVPFYAFFNTDSFRQILFFPGAWAAEGTRRNHLLVATSDLADAAAWVVQPVVYARREPRTQVSFQQDNTRFVQIVPGNDYIALSFIPRSIKQQKVITETVEITHERALSVYDVLARYQQKKAVSDQSLKRYVANGTTRYYITSPYLNDSFEIKTSNVYFYSRFMGKEWAEKEIFINGARWNREGFPEVPFLESGQLEIEPAAIELSERYDYRLLSDTTVEGRPCYVVAFAARPECPDEVSGRICIDKQTFYPMELQYSQEDLEPPFVSKNQSEWYRHFTDKDAVIFIPERIEVHESLKMAGYTVNIDKQRTYATIDLNPADYEAQRQEAYASRHTMMRATPTGPRILKRDTDGNRVLEQEIRKHFFFLVGGLRGDLDSDYPVLPFAGVNYFDYDLFGKGHHVNIFSAVVVNSITFSTGKPVLGGLFDDFQANLAGSAIAFTDAVYQDGTRVNDYDVDILPVYLDLELSKRLGDNARFNLRSDMLVRAFSRADDNENAAFIVPKDDQVFSHGLDLDWSVYGFSAIFGGSYNWRSRTSAYGLDQGEDNPLLYGQTLKDYLSWYAKIRKDWHFSGFDMSVSLGYRSLSDYDRFNLYDLGSGLSGIHGFGSGRVKADSTYDLHVIAGVDIADVLKWKVYYDGSYVHDVLTDDYDFYHGVGCSFSFILFKSYICNFDYGYGINQPTDDGKTGNHVFMLTFLKLLF